MAPTKIVVGKLYKFKIPTRNEYGHIWHATQKSPSLDKELPFPSTLYNVDDDNVYANQLILALTEPITNNKLAHTYFKALMCDKLVWCNPAYVEEVK